MGSGLVDLILRLKTEMDKGDLDKAKGSFQQLAVVAAAAFAAYGGARAVGDFFRDSAAAAEAEEMSLIKLRSVLSGVTDDYKNMSAEVNDWALKVAYNSLNSEEEIIGAFQQVVAVTGDVKNAYAVVQTSVDIAAARNKDLSSVVEAVSKAYQGNFMMLVRLVPELRASIDAGASMADIMDQLGRFTGTAAGQMDGALGTIRATALAWGEVEEAVGGVIIAAKGVLAQGLLEAMNALGLGDTNSQALALKLQILEIRKILENSIQDGLFGEGLYLKTQSELLTEIADKERQIAELTGPIREGWSDVGASIGDAANKAEEFNTSGYNDVGAPRTAFDQGGGMPILDQATINQLKLQGVQTTMDAYQLQLEVAKKQAALGVAGAQEKYLALLQEAAQYLQTEQAQLSGMGVTQNELLKLLSSELSMRQQIKDITDQQTKAAKEAGTGKGESIFSKVAGDIEKSNAEAAKSAQEQALSLEQERVKVIEAAAQARQDELRALTDLMNTSEKIMTDAQKEWAGGYVATAVAEAAFHSYNDRKLPSVAGGAGATGNTINMGPITIEVNGTNLDPAAIAQAIEQRLRTFSETAGNAIGNLPL
jgi:hypothetical protein